MIVLGALSGPRLSWARSSIGTLSSFATQIRLLMSSGATFSLLVLAQPRIKSPLPFVNLKYDGGIADPNDAMQFVRRVHGAPRLAQAACVLFVGHDEEAPGEVAPQFDGQAFQNAFQWFGFLRGCWSQQCPPRDAQIVRHGIFAPLTVREKRGKR